MRVVRVAIEVGHGPQPHGPDQPGALGPEGLTEHALNIFMAYQLAGHLGDFPAPDHKFLCNVIDEPLPLAMLGRLGTAHDVFVSMHLNASAHKDVQGSEVLVHSRDRQTSLNLAESIEGWLHKRLKLPFRGVKERPDLAILSAVPAEVPACLVESFFIDAMHNKAECFEYADAATRAIANGVAYFILRGVKSALN